MPKCVLADLANASTPCSPLDLPLEYALLPAWLARAVRKRPVRDAQSDASVPESIG